MATLTSLNLQHKSSNPDTHLSLYAVTAVNISDDTLLFLKQELVDMIAWVFLIIIIFIGINHPLMEKALAACRASSVCAASSKKEKLYRLQLRSGTNRRTSSMELAAGS